MSSAGRAAGGLVEAEGLVNRLLDDELSAAGACRLEKLLRERRQVRRFYILEMHLWCCSMPYALHEGDAADLANVDVRGFVGDISRLWVINLMLCRP